MRVTVLLFARLRELADRSEWSCEVPAGSSAADVWSQLAATFPAVADLAPSVSCAVNANFASMATTLADGDEVAFLPPVSGG